MKKFLTAALSGALALSLLAGCGSSGTTTTTAATTAATEATTEALKPINVGASPSPHSEILEEAKPLMAEKGYELTITEFTDYVQPNNVVDTGEVDANYFQHQPYLDDFNAENGTHLVSVSAVHVEPMGIYGGKQTSLDAITGNN